MSKLREQNEQTSKWKKMFITIVIGTCPFYHMKYIHALRHLVISVHSIISALRPLRKFEIITGFFKVSVSIDWGWAFLLLTQNFDWNRSKCVLISIQFSLNRLWFTSFNGVLLLITIFCGYQLSHVWYFFDFKLT